MRWLSISRPRLGMLSVIAFGMLARPAAAQHPVGEFTEHGDVGTVTRPGSASYDSTYRRVSARRIRCEHLGLVAMPSTSRGAG